MSHYTDRTHIFHNEDGDRLAVITTQAGHSDYEAFIIGGRPEEIPDYVELRGVGNTRLKAIDDLRDQIDRVLERLARGGAEL